jgi:hypothetical protein
LKISGLTIGWIRSTICLILIKLWELQNQLYQTPLILREFKRLSKVLVPRIRGLVIGLSIIYLQRSIESLFKSFKNLENQILRSLTSTVSKIMTMINKLQGLRVNRLLIPILRKIHFWSETVTNKFYHNTFKRFKKKKKPLSLNLKD